MILIWIWLDFGWLRTDFGFGLIRLDFWFDLIWIWLDFGLASALSLTFTRIFAHSGLSEALIALQEVPRTCEDFLGLATALIVDLLPLATLPPSITS